MIRINDIYACVQGEGCLAGTPMVLVRLHGCGVGCPWCDTKETWAVDAADRVDSIGEARGPSRRWAAMEPGAIADEARGLGPGIGWALLTGGEPAEQRLAPLADALRDAGFKVALETSGTALGHMDAAIDWACVSPKFDMPGGRPVLPETLESADEIKHVVGKAADIDRLDATLAGLSLRPGVQVCLQPVSQSPAATELCYRACLERGWRLSLQLHKYLGKA